MKKALAFVCLLSIFASSGSMQSKQSETPENLITWTDFQPASRVLGQTDFITATSGAGNNKFSVPQQAVVDPTTGKVFVSDFSNNRVLRFSSVQAATNGGVAEAVLGQPDFDTVTSGTTQSKMFSPQGISIDSAGRLWVALTSSHRVLRFDNAATKASGANADGVLGQTLFTTLTSATTQNGMSAPRGVFADSAGRVWVADQNNRRVLRFDNAAAKADGANADGVLGQTLFTTNTIATTQNGMNQPVGVTVDSTGRWWVAEAVNHRVLRFDNAAAKANGADADGVLGQTLFTTATIATTQNGMNTPRSVSHDAAGRLYVSDQNNHRILIFDNAAALANGANASNVLGQPGFVTATPNNGGISANSLSGPRLVLFDEASQNLFVGDGANNRVLRFGPAFTPTAASVTVGGRVMVGTSGLRNARVYLTDQNGETRMAMTSSFGYFRFADIAAGQSVIITVVSKRYQFEPQVVNVFENIEDLNFYAEF